MNCFRISSDGINAALFNPARLIMTLFIEYHITNYDTKKTVSLFKIQNDKNNSFKYWKMNWEQTYLKLDESHR